MGIRAKREPLSLPDDKIPPCPQAAPQSRHPRTCRWTGRLPLEQLQPLRHGRARPHRDRIRMGI